MIKFVRLRDFGDEGERGFSFFDTKRDKYVSMNNKYVWLSEKEFISDFVEQGETHLERFTDLIPKNWESIHFQVSISEEILDRALAEHGLGSQIEMCVEECAELIQALQKRKRVYSKTSDPDTLIDEDNKVVDELADVSILIKQLTRCFGSEEVQARINFKLERLEKRMDEGFGY